MTESKKVPSLAEVLTADASAPVVDSAGIDGHVSDAIRLALAESEDKRRSFVMDYLSGRSSADGAPTIAVLEYVKRGDIEAIANRLATADIGFKVTKAARWIRDCYTSGQEKRKANERQAKQDKAASVEQKKEANAAITGGDTWPYTIDGGKLTYMWEDKAGDICYEPIASFEAAIKAQLIDEYGNSHYTIIGQAVSGQPFTVEISSTHFSESSKLKAVLETAAGPRDPVYARMEPHVGPAIKLLSTGEIDTRFLRHRTGWDNDKFLIRGREPEATEIRVDSKVYYAVPTDGDLEAGKVALANLMAVLPKTQTTAILSAVMGPPAARLAGWQENKYGLFNRGVTGSQKTTKTRLFMALWGAGILTDGNVLGFGNKTTINAIMHIASQCADLPFLVDNWKPNTSRNGEKDFYVLAHAMLEGGDKVRMRQYGHGLQDSMPIDAWPIFTGEDLPSGDPATVARMLTILFKKNEGTVCPELDAAQATQSNLPIIGNAWIEWLESDEGKAQAKAHGALLNEVRSYWLKFLLANRASMANPHRVATNLAINELTYRLLTCAPFGDVLQPYTEDHRAGLERIALDAGDFSGGGLEARRFVEALRELISTGRAILIQSQQHYEKMVVGDRDRVIGWAGGEDSAYIYPAVAFNMVSRLTGDDFNGLTRYALLQQMATLDWLASTDKDRLEKSSKISGKKERYIHLNNKALEEPDVDSIELPDFDDDNPMVDEVAELVAKGQAIKAMSAEAKTVVLNGKHSEVEEWTTF